MKNPKTRLLRGTSLSGFAIALTLFLSAGTVNYWQAWAYLATTIFSSIPYIRYLLKNTRLLENRTKAGPTAENRSIQKAIVLLGGLSTGAAFTVAGLDHRFGWSSVPLWLVILGDFLVFFGMWMVYRTVKENSFASAIVEVVEDQRVISTGPYALVRNPMYASALIYLVGMSLALGSYWTLIPIVLTMLSIIWRVFDEEAFLEKNLSGYTEYCAKVRWHLIPLIF